MSNHNYHEGQEFYGYVKAHYTYELDDNDIERLNNGEDIETIFQDGIIFSPNVSGEEVTDWDCEPK